MAARNAAKDQELKEIQAAAEKMAERMNVRFVLNDGKVKEFIGLEGDKYEEDQSFSTDVSETNHHQLLNC